MVGVNGAARPRARSGALSSCLLVGSLLSASRARAEDTPPVSKHRVMAAVGQGFVWMTRPDYGERSADTLGLRGLYGYQALSHLEMGAGLTFFDMKGVGTIFAPHGTLRPFFRASPQAGSTEFGFSFHLGMMFGDYNRTTWRGLFLSLGPDLRVPLGRGVALQFSAEAAVLGGRPTGPFDETSYHQPAFEYGIWMAVVVSL